MRLTFLLPILALVAPLAACNDVRHASHDVRDVINDLPPPFFGDVGNDPHPPRLTLLGIGLLPPGDPPPPVTYFSPSTVLTVRPFDSAANTLALKVSYADAAGDLDSITVRDLDGPIAGTLELPEFPGTSGTLEGTLAVPPSAQAGTHNLEIWAQDANGSRSPKTSFAVTVQLF